MPPFHSVNRHRKRFFSINRIILPNFVLSTIERCKSLYVFTMMEVFANFKRNNTFEDLTKNW